VELETWAGEEIANTPIVDRARARKRGIGGGPFCDGPNKRRNFILEVPGETVNLKAERVWRIVQRYARSARC
jgi:hypothetical protein